MRKSDERYFLGYNARQLKFTYITEQYIDLTKFN